MPDVVLSEQVEVLWTGMVGVEIPQPIFVQGRVGEASGTTDLLVAIPVSVECDGDRPTAWHESAWTHFEADRAAYELALRGVLVRLASGSTIATESVDALDAHVALAAIILYDAGRAGLGYSSFEFDVEWDSEHGASVLMHGTNPLGVSGRADFTGRGDPSGHATYCPVPKPGGSRS